MASWASSTHVAGAMALSAVVAIAPRHVTADARQDAVQALGERPAAVTKFLASTDTGLVSYRATRKLSVVTRGGKMQASLTARTTFDPDRGFQYQVLEEDGSGMLRSRVLHSVLEAERDAKRREQAARGALTSANYRFTAAELTDEGLLRVAIHPLRKDTLLVDGNILLTPADGDLVRVEGQLVKRPSFWTRRVDIVRKYCRIGGVRVPISMGSTAEVLFAGTSTFVMDYEYESINGIDVVK